MKNTVKDLFWLVKVAVGSALFALGFDLFLGPNDLNGGGLSGLAQLLVELLGFGSVGLFVALINLPLFALGGMKIGKRFFIGSLVGLVTMTVALELFENIPYPETDHLLAALYGGVVCGLGAGIVFAAGGSTGGSDIIVRLMKRRMEHVPIGMITTCFDIVVALLTGVVFRDMSRSLYTGVTIFVMGRVIDSVVYSFDYSKAVMIISKDHEAIASMINVTLDRGATYLHGEGTYSRQEKNVIFTVVKKQQIADLKRFVVEIDPDAFIVVQEAHQVLGEGFGRYTRDAL